MRTMTRSEWRCGRAWLIASETSLAKERHGSPRLHTGGRQHSKGSCTIIAGPCVSNVVLPMSIVSGARDHTKTILVDVQSLENAMCWRRESSICRC